ncbi:MAG: hypothetical protein KDD82_19225 [Planctomycetes bacterium]|nr:hypothetical protein [Planctomycetota bacterium]
MSSFTSSSDPERRGFTPPWALLAAAVVVACWECLALALPVAAVDPSERLYLKGAPSLERSIVYWQLEHTLSSSEPQDVLLLGDSSCLMGLRPKTIEQATGLSAWNLGTLAFPGVGGHRRLYDAYRAKRGAPRFVIYHMSLYLLLQEAPRFQLNASRAPEPLPPQTPPSRQLRVSLARLRNAWLRDRFLEVERGPYPSDLEVGAFLALSKGALEEPLRRPWGGALRFGEAHVSADCRRGLDELLSELGRDACPALLVLNPIPEALATPENLETLRVLEAEVQQIAARHPLAEVYAPFGRTYPNGLLATLDHLTVEGAERESLEVAAWLRAQAERPPRAPPGPR